MWAVAIIESGCSSKGLPENSLTGSGSIWFHILQCEFAKIDRYVTLCQCCFEIKTGMINGNSLASMLQKLNKEA